MVTATSPAMRGAASELTDDDGNYYLAGLPPGAYDVTFHYAGAKVRRAVPVDAGASVRLDVRMPLQTPLGVLRMVRMRRRPPVIDVNSDPL